MLWRSDHHDHSSRPRSGWGVLLCFISTDAAGIEGTEGFTGDTAPKLFSPTSVAGYAGPSFSLQTTPEVPVLLSEVQSGVLHLLGLIRGAPRGQGDPHLVLGG